MDRELKALGLQKRWPRLARLQTEISGLEKRNRDADLEVQRLQAELGPAREADLDLEAQAVRAGKGVPEPTQEPEVKSKLERAMRDRDVMARALQAAQTDHGAFLAQYRDELYRDVAQARAEIASKVSEAAREALAGYSKHEGTCSTRSRAYSRPSRPSRRGRPEARTRRRCAPPRIPTSSASKPRARMDLLVAR